MRKPLIFHNCGITASIFLILLIGGIVIPTEVAAEVVRLEITSREVISDLPELIGIGPYEVIKGIIYLEVNPDNPANQQIVDLKLAPRNSRGYVEFSTEFELHKPVDADRGNHRLLYFVNNRGHKMGEWHFNSQAGKNWLYSRGWSYLWCGWNCDVPESDSRLNINVPTATEDGKTITGKIYAEMISYEDAIVYSLPVVWGGSTAYPAASEDKSQTSLTMRRYRWDEPVELQSDSWSFGRYEDGRMVPDADYIYLKDGFKPGWLYDLVYVGKDPKITGLGLAAIRDVVSFFKYEKADAEGSENPLAGVVEHVYAWGHSQSARLLYHYIYQGFNGDEKQRMVLDGVMANCPGAGKGLFNSRFAQPTRHGSHHEDNLYPIDFFPFATVEQVDPVTGESGDALARAREQGFPPKIFFINSSTDYWTRAASLLHTDVEGKVDAGIDPNVRIYSVAGRAHVDDRIGLIGRALLTALDQWVSRGIEPPASQIPRISDGTLVDLETWSSAFPDIPGVLKPPSYYHPYRLDMGPHWETEGIADNTPPKAGPRYVCLVPLVDEDGNEIAGIRLPEITAPLATYAGWSMRSPLFSRTLRRNAGSYWPLSRTAEERRQRGDPRKSILERYQTKADYLLEVTKCLLNLRSQRFLLDEDVSGLLMEAGQVTYWPAAEDVQQVAVKEVSMQPAEVKPADTVLLSVVFEGAAESVLTVQGKLREANNLYYILNNNGVNGDEKEGDEIWSCEIIVPMGIPSGQFHIDFQALDKDLNAIYLTGTVKGGMGEQGSLIFTVK
jgi:hypothetical protein